MYNVNIRIRTNNSRFESRVHLDVHVLYLQLKTKPCIRNIIRLCDVRSMFVKCGRNVQRGKKMKFTVTNDSRVYLNAHVLYLQLKTKPCLILLDSVISRVCSSKWMFNEPIFVQNGTPEMNVPSNGTILILIINNSVNYSKTYTNYTESRRID